MDKTRNVATCPEPGDFVTKGNLRRNVTAVVETGRHTTNVYYRDQNGRGHVCSLNTWKTWVQRAQREPDTFNYDIPAPEWTLNEYQNKAMATNGNAGESLTVSKPLNMLLNAGLGLAGESGEFVDHLKKVLFHNHPLDETYAIKELGDILWYVNQGAKALGKTLQDIAEVNIAKLAARYPEGFTPERSINREN